MYKNKRELKLLEYYEDALDTPWEYKGDLEDIKFRTTSKAGTFGNFHTFFGCNMAVFKTQFENSDAVVFVFNIGINKEEESRGVKSKYVSEKILEIVKKMEDVFISLDYINCKHIKVDHVLYVIIVKKVVS